MALILNIETATEICSVCLSKDGLLLEYREDHSGTSHAKLLTVFIDQLLKAGNFKPQDLDAVAVSSGPGSYTGLRIGASVAKGLCYALEKPLISVPTLLSLESAIEQKVNNSAAYYMPCLDARRMDIYTAIYTIGNKLIMPVDILTVDKLLEEKIISYGETYIGGNGTEKCRKVFGNPAIHYNEEIFCDSRNMISDSEAKYIKREFEDIAYFEPFYLKDFGVKN